MNPSRNSLTNLHFRENIVAINIFWNLAPQILKHIRCHKKLVWSGIWLPHCNLHKSGVILWEIPHTPPFYHVYWHPKSPNHCCCSSLFAGLSFKTGLINIQQFPLRSDNVECEWYRQTYIYHFVHECYFVFLLLIWFLYLELWTLNANKCLCKKFKNT